MLTYERKLRLNDLEVFMVFKNNVSLGYLVIEDLKRPLTQEDIETSFDYMTEEDIGVYKNIIKVDIVTDDILLQEDKEFIEIFADGLVDTKDYCATIYKYKVDRDLFEQLGLTEDIPFYQLLLLSTGSKFDISRVNLDKLMYLSQE